MISNIQLMSLLVTAGMEYGLTEPVAKELAGYFLTSIPESIRGASVSCVYEWAPARCDGWPKEMNPLTKEALASAFAKVWLQYDAAKDRALDVAVEAALSGATAVQKLLAERLAVR